MAPSRNIRAGRAYVEIAADSTKLQRGLREAQVQLKSFGKAAQEVGREMIALSAAMALPFAFSAKSFASFDDSMRLAQAVTQATGEDFEQLTRTAQRLGRETSFTAQQVADAMVSLGRMGFSPREIENAIADVLNLARATGTELAEAADFAANSMRIFAIESTDMARVADVLTVTANSSAQTLVDLFEALKIAGPQAHAAGENIEETSAALGVLANMGIKGSLAGTALRKSFSQFAKLDVQKTLAQWGVSTTDAEGNLRKLADVMVDIAKVMQTMPTAQRLTFAEEIFDLRGSLAGLSITANVDELNAFLKKLQDVGGVAAETSQKMDAGLGGSFRLLASAAEGSMNAIGATLARTLQPMINNMITGLNAFTGWIEENGKLITQIALAVAAIGALGVALFTIGTAAKITAAGIGAVRSVVTGLHTAFNALKTASVAVGQSISSIAYAFSNYNKMAQPALVSTSRLLAALHLPIDRRANQIAASLLLMSRAETAATAKSALAAKWRLATSIFSKATAATIASTVATKAHTVAELASAAASKTRAIAAALVAGLTAKLTLATVLSTAAGTANAAMNTALAISTKLAAAGYLALNMAMRAFCAIPVVAIAAAIVGALVYVYRSISKASKYTAQLSDNMAKLREEGEKSRQVDSKRMQRLTQLSQKQQLSNDEIAEAEKLAASLTERYGDLGITIDKMAGSLTMATGAQNKFNSALRESSIDQIDAEIAELKNNYDELTREFEATRHWSNYNYWSALSGANDEANARQEEILNEQNVIYKKINALEKRRDAIRANEEDYADDLAETAELEAKIAQEENERAAALQELADAEEREAETEQEAKKRTAEIERELRRERQTSLENEIEDIKDLTDEYVRLQEILKAKAKERWDFIEADAITEKIQEAYRIRDERIRKAEEADAKARGATVTEVEDQYAQDVNAATSATDERVFADRLAKLKDQDAGAAVSLLDGLVQRLAQNLDKARAEYAKTIAEATADGAVSEDERQTINDVAQTFNRAASLYEKYAAELTNAKNAVEESETKNDAKTFGSFYAAAMRGLGVSSYQDKALKASENTAKNTKRTVRLLEDMSKTSIAFT